jgi:hypothetical protein
MVQQHQNLTQRYQRHQLMSIMHQQQSSLYAFRHFASKVSAAISVHPDERSLLESLSRNIEYQNAWDTDSVEPLHFDVKLDRQTRYLLQLLSDLREVGLRKSVETVTLERCNRVIQELAQSEADFRSSSNCWQRAERARLILEHMEAFCKLETEAKKFKLDTALPLPTHETFWQVLKLFSSKYLHGSAQVPEICHEIVQRMEDSNKPELQPTTLHWNQVIMAWANSTDPQRSIKAAQIVYNLDEKGLADASSFSHALRACVSLSSRNQDATEAFSTLAIPVAQRIKNGLIARRVPLEAFHFVHLLRVGRNLPEGEEERDRITLETWQQATEYQKVNVHVLQELLQVASPKLLIEILGQGYDRDPLRLILTIPKDWIDSATDTKNPFEW